MLVTQYSTCLLGVTEQGDTVPRSMTGSQCKYSRLTGGRDGWNGRRDRVSHDVERERLVKGG